MNASTEPVSRRGLLRAKILLALFSAILVLAALEVFLRIAAYPPSPWRPPPPAVINPYDANPYILKGRPFLFTYRPGTVYTAKYDVFEITEHVNSRGFRGPEMSARPPKDKKRLLILGDSMVEGHGVEFEETFCALLNRPGLLSGWETLNVGIQGAAPTYYAANLPRYLALHPDAVLVVLYNNDPRDDYGMNYELPGLGIFPDADRVLLEGLAPPGAKGLRLTALAAMALGRGGGVPAAWTGREAVEAVNLKHLTTNRIYRPGFQFSLGSFAVSESEWPDVWTLTADYLELFHKALAEREIPFLLIHLSLQYSMASSRPDWRRHARMFSRSAGDWAGERRIPFLSLGAPLRSELDVTGRPRILFPEDNHLNPLGHRLVAEILAPWLAERLGAQDREKEGNNAASH